MHVGSKRYATVISRVVQFLVGSTYTYYDYVWNKHNPIERPDSVWLNDHLRNLLETRIRNRNKNDFACAMWIRREWKLIKNTTKVHTMVSVSVTPIALPPPQKKRKKKKKIVIRRWLSDAESYVLRSLLPTLLHSEKLIVWTCGCLRKTNLQVEVLWYMCRF